MSRHDGVVTTAEGLAEVPAQDGAEEPTRGRVNGAATGTDVSRTSAAELEEMWRRQLVAWHLLFGILLVVTALLVLAIGHEMRWAQLACVVGIAAAYAVWGRRGLGERAPRAAGLYLTIAWGLFLVLVLLDPQGYPWLLTFGLMPQTWASIGRNRAVVVVTGATVAFGGVVWWSSGRSSSDALGVLISMTITLTVSIVLGLFIDRIMREAVRRAETIDELRRTQNQLAAVEREQGTLHERERLSREIHDTLAQGFTSILALARAADSAASRGQLTLARERLRLVESTAVENLAEARRLVAALTPGHLVSSTLPEAFQRVVVSASESSGIPGRLVVTGQPSQAAANSEVVLLRTLQEALANVRRHSGASSFEVRLSFDRPDTVALSVTDDGRGFDPMAPRTGFGLNGARSRAADVGSSLEVESSMGQGTTLRLEVPRGTAVADDGAAPR